MVVNSRSFHLPRFLGNWPWERRVNPHYSEVYEESRTWLEDFGIFSPRAQRAFNACNFSLLAALLYPRVSKDRLRSACDMMNMFFLYDEFTDAETKEGVENVATISMDAVRNPTIPRPVEENPVGEIVRQSWGKSTLTAPSAARNRFIEGMDQHTAAMTEQADDRSRGYLPMRSIASYLDLRRHTMGAKPAFAFLAFDFDLPAHVFENPCMENIEKWAADLLILSNDLYSYPKEYADGDDGHNIVTIAMNELGIDLDGAVKWAQEYHDRTEADFLNAAKSLPLYEDDNINAQLASYVEGIALFVRGHDSWCFESARYFGKNGLEVQKERVVALHPRRNEL